MFTFGTSPTESSISHAPPALNVLDANEAFAASSLYARILLVGVERIPFLLQCRFRANF